MWSSITISSPGLKSTFTLPAALVRMAVFTPKRPRTRTGKTTCGML